MTPQALRALGGLCPQVRPLLAKLTECKPHRDRMLSASLTAALGTAHHHSSARDKASTQQAPAEQTTKGAARGSAKTGTGY